MKFGVGILLTSFGIFWGGEGAGAHWPGSDGALIAVIAVIAGVSVAGTAWMRRIKQGQDAQHASAAVSFTGGTR
jgi:uncharacterized membrane protein